MSHLIMLCNNGFPTSPVLFPAATLSYHSVGPQIGAYWSLPLGTPQPMLCGARRPNQHPNPSAKFSHAPVSGSGGSVGMRSRYLPGAVRFTVRGGGGEYDVSQIVVWIGHAPL